MKVLIAILFAACSASASAMPLCLGTAQTDHAPAHLNFRLEMELDAANPFHLIFKSDNKTSDSWTYIATNDIYPARRAFLHCRKLVEGFQNARFAQSMKDKSDREKLNMVLLLSMGIHMGLSISSHNACSQLDQSQVYVLLGRADAPEASLGRYILVSNVNGLMQVMEGTSGFIYHQQGCAKSQP